MAVTSRRQQADAADAAPSPQTSGWRERLVDGLFCQAPRARPTVSGVAAFVAVGVTGVFVSLLRQRGLTPLDTIWAEDGRVFLTQALELPFAEALVLPAGGYLQVYPRLVGALAGALPLRLAPETMTTGAAGAAVGLALVVYLATAGHIRSRVIRGALAAATLLSPIAGAEMINNLANVQWYLVFASFWVLLWRPQRVLALVAGGGVLALAATSAPVSALLAPVAGLRLVLVRSWRDRVLPLVFAAGLAAQAWRILTTPNPGEVGGNAAEIAQGFAQRVATATLFGHELAVRLWFTFGWGLPIVATAVIAAALAYGAARRDLRTRPAIVLCGIMAVAVFAGSAYLRGNSASFLWQLGDAHVLSGRYVYVPVMLLLSMLALLLDDRPARISASTWRGLQATALALLFFCAGQDFFIDNPRSEGPSWSAGLAEARADCPDDEDGVVAVPISPDPGWYVYLPCDRLVAPDRQAQAPRSRPATWSMMP